jgi:hypothetical protein
MPEISWTKHSEAKIRFHHLSKQRVRRVLNSPKRIETGIAPDTMAMMQVSGSKKHPYEIWVMFVKKRQLGGKIGMITKIISAWRYPGVTKPGEPLPPEIMAEIRESL